MKLPRWPLPALLLFAALALALFLGTRGLNEPDEGRYAEIGREMAASGDWLVPHLNGIPHFQKPPMLYWATAASLRIFGPNEWAARLPSALAAFGVVALTYWIGALLFQPATGIAAGGVLLSMLGFFIAGRLLTPDMLLTFWITAACACLVRRGRGGGALWGWLFFVAMGCGFLTKGPMALVVPVAAALAWQGSRRRSDAPLRLPWAGGLVLTLALGLSWFVVLSLRSEELFRYFLGDELVKRFASTGHGRSKPFWFFAWVLPAAIFPWTFVFLTMLGSACARWRRGWRPSAEQWLLLGWIALPLVVLSCSGSKLSTYILPLLPPLAIAIGHWTRTPENRRLWNGAMLVTIVILAVVTLGIRVAQQIAQVDLPDAYLILPGLLACAILLRHQPVTARLVVALSAVFVWLAAVDQMSQLNDALAQQASVKPLVARLRTAPDFARATLFACEVRAHGWEFYAGRLTHMTRADADVVLPLTPEQAARMIRSAGRCEEAMLPRAPAYGLVRAGRFARSFTAEKWKVLGRAGDFLLIGTRDAALAAE